MNQYDHLKNKLHHYKVDIDKEKLWENTSHAIPRKNRRGTILIMLFAGLLFSGWILHTTSILPFSKSRLSSNSTETVHAEPLAQNIGADTEMTTTRSDEPGERAVKETSSSNAHVESTPVTALQQQKTPIPISINAEDVYTINIRKKHEDALSTENSETWRGEIIPDKHSINKVHADVISILNLEQSPTNFDSEMQSDFNANNRILNLPVTYMLKVISPIPLTSQKVKATGSHSPVIPSKKARLHSVQLVQGAGLSTMSVQSRNPASLVVAEQLGQKMRSLEILSTSATATIKLTEKFSLVSGIQWKQLATVIEHEWQSTERVEMEGVQQVIIGRNGIEETVTGTTAFTRLHTIHARRFTSHDRVDIIVALHRVIWNAQRLSLHGFVKGNYNLAYHAEGSTLNNEGDLYGFSKTENPFQQASPFSIGGGLQLNYRIAPKWNFISHITLDQFHFELIQEEAPIGFHHSGFSLGFGIGYIF